MKTPAEGEFDILVDMKVSIKRVYEKVEKKDGTRILVDRLWPRGLTKSKAHIDHWAKEVAPSTALRKWFHADPEARYKNFALRYRKELSKNPALKELHKYSRVTLLTSAKDIEHSHVSLIAERLR